MNGLLYNRRNACPFVYHSACLMGSVLLMKWNWIDRIIEFEPGKRALAVKNVSISEDVVHDYFEEVLASDDSVSGMVRPIMPGALIIEGMAQTAGLLVSHVNNFREKVILAKISRATLERDVVPGQTLFFEAEIERIDPTGASTNGRISVYDHGSETMHDLGIVQMLFSHIDQNRAGISFPKHNFVFTDDFRTLLRISNIEWEEL